MRKQPFRISMAVLITLLIAAPSVMAAGEAIEWNSLNGGGSSSTGTYIGTNYTMTGSLSQFAVYSTSDAGNTLRHGFQVSAPADASIDCRNGGSACVPTTGCYGPSEATFTFRNTMCAAPPCVFQKASTQYYQYLWQTSSTYTHAGLLAGGEWSSSASWCEGGSCSVAAGTTMDMTANTTSDTWYLIARSFNGGQCATGSASCQGLTNEAAAILGPYRYDQTGPTLTAQAIGVSSTAYTSGTTWVDGTFDISLSGITDTGCSTISSCDYTLNGGTGWSAGTYSAGACNVTGATCTDAQAMTINMRATDSEGNTGTGNAISATCDTTAPVSAFSAPANDSWQKANFAINVTDSDTASGVASCQYMVESYSGSWTTTKTWTARTCNSASSATITVGAAQDCRNEGSTASGYCRVSVRATDNVGNVASATSRTFKIDWTAPVVAGTVTPSNTDYSGLYVDSPYDLSVGTISDATSGTSTCEYTVNGSTWNSVGGYSAGGATCSTTGLTCTNGAALTLNFRITDQAGNTGTGTQVTRTCDTQGPVAGTVTTPSSAPDYGTTTHVKASSFRISTTFTDAPSGVASCEYCKSNDGTCDTEWANGSWTASPCLVGTLTCTSGDTLTLNMRATDNVSNLTTATAVNRTCDGAAPTAPTYSVSGCDYTSGTSCWVKAGTVTTHRVRHTDALSTPVRQYLTFTDYSTPCNPNSCAGAPREIKSYVNTDTGAFTDQMADNTYLNISGASCTEAGGCAGTAAQMDYSVTAGTTNYYYKIWTYMYDEVFNGLGYTFVNQYLRIDVDAPNNPTVAGYNSSAKTVTLTSGDTYSYDAPTGPYFEWTAPSDNPSGAASGIAGYYIYFGTNSSADPATLGTYQTTANYTNSLDLTPGTTYYLRLKTKDNVGNISSAVTAFTYAFSGGAYMVVSEIDVDGTLYGTDLGSSDGATSSSSSGLDGVLNPNNTEFEIVTITLYNEQDDIVPTTKPVTVTLGNIGSTGAYIHSTNIVGASGVGTASVSGTLTAAGTAWIKVRATATQDEAIVVSADATDSSLTLVGGRNQSAYILLRTPTGLTTGITNVDLNALSPLAGETVMMPVWNHKGDAVVVAAKTGAIPYWNLYQLKWNGASWDTTKLTNDAMCVQPYLKYSYNATDDKVVFAGRNSGDSGCPTGMAPAATKEMFAVRADGFNANDTLSMLGMSNTVSNGGTVNFHWGDVSWSHSSTTCSSAPLLPDASSAADTMLLTLAPNAPGSPSQLYYLNGSKNFEGIYTELESGTPTKITDLGMNTWALQGSWSNDCSKIVFVAWQGWNPSDTRTGIYVIDLTVATLPITSLTDTGVTAVHECTTADCSKKPALYPTFSADDSMIAYMVDRSATFKMTDLLFCGAGGYSIPVVGPIQCPGGDGIAANFFRAGVNFDMYLEYWSDGIFTPQRMGQNPENNEFGLSQCFSSDSSLPCYNSSNGNLMTYITQKQGSRDGALSFLELGSVSQVTSQGGLLFYQGSVTAVFPPGSVDSDTVITVNSDAPVAAPDSRDDVLVSTGEARDFLPDGAKFDQDIRLVFHYCDADNDGFLDTLQDPNCSGSGGTLDENDLYAYYWCEDAASSIGCSPNTWIRLDGSVDQTNNMLTVITNHFSTYDMFNLTRGRVAPAVVGEINIIGLRTFPNPWRAGQGNITFYADGASAVDAVVTTVELNIYDIRGKLVKSITKSHAGGVPASLDNGVAGGYALAQWDARNNSGKQVASGVYTYVLRVSNSTKTRAQVLKGKLAIVR